MAQYNMVMLWYIVDDDIYHSKCYCCTHAAQIKWRTMNMTPHCQRHGILFSELTKQNGDRTLCQQSIFFI